MKKVLFLVICVSSSVYGKLAPELSKAERMDYNRELQGTELPSGITLEQVAATLIVRHILNTTRKRKPKFRSKL